MRPQEEEEEEDNARCSPLEVITDRVTETHMMGWLVTETEYRVQFRTEEGAARKPADKKEVARPVGGKGTGKKNVARAVGGNGTAAGKKKAGP